MAYTHKHNENQALLSRKKEDKAFFGYKNHVDIDRRHRLVRTYDVTTASIQGSQVFEDILDIQNSALDIWARQCLQN